jgi:hypothetical protein
MNERSYVGIDNTDKNEWIVVLWCEGKSVFSRPYKNIPQEMAALVRFITDRCDRPKICLNPTHPNSFELVKFISNIVGVEVVLMSNAGLRLHLDWLPRESSTPVFQANSRRAYLLACCAERMI